CQLIGYKDWWHDLESKRRAELAEMIYDRVNPDSRGIRDQYLAALDLFDVDYSPSDSSRALQLKLYEFNSRALGEAIAKMSEEERAELAKEIEECVPRDVLDHLNQAGQVRSSAASGVVMLQ